MYLAEPSLKSSRQVPTDWAIHTYAPPAFCRTNRSFDAVVVQKQPESSNEAMCGPGRECSRVKSSTKVSLLAGGPSGLISGGLALSACPTGLNECRPWLRLAVRRFVASRFLRRLIALPVIQLRT